MPRGTPKESKAVFILVKAMLVDKNPAEMTVRRIAEMVPCNEKYLYRCHVFRALWDLSKQMVQIGAETQKQTRSAGFLQRDSDNRKIRPVAISNPNGIEPDE